MDIKSYVPLDKLKAAHQSNKKFVLCNGAYGTGKTTFLCNDVAEFCMLYPGMAWWFGRKYNEDMVKTTRSIFYREVNADLVDYTERGGEICYMKGGGKITFGGLYTRQKARLKIPVAAGYAIDELMELNDQDFNDIIGRMRGDSSSSEHMAGEEYPLVFRAASNPPNKDHWMYKKWVEQGSQDYDLYKVSMYDNPYLSKDYIRTCEDEYRNNPSLFNRIVLGEWGFISQGAPVYGGFKIDVHVKDVKFNPAKPILRGWDFGWHHPCYDKETQILTKEGWKYFYDVKDNESVITLNSETKEIEYQNIEAKIQHLYTGKMHHWKSERNNIIDINVTHNHFMVEENYNKDLVFKQAFEVAKLKRKMKLPKAFNWSGIDCSRVSLGSIEMDLSVFSGFMGIYLSEGSLNSYGNHYNIWIWQKDRKKEIEDLLNKMPIKFSWQKDGWVGSSKEFYEYLLLFGKCYQKYVPECIKDANKEVIGEFIRFYGIGDGSKRNGKVILITTTSNKMADDLQELYLKLGKSTKIVKSIRTDKGHFGKRPIYTVRINSYTRSLRNRDLKIKEVIDEAVYCVTVPNHIIYVRRNGIAMWCGNCVVYGQFDSFDRFLVLDTVLGEKTYIDTFADKVIKYSNENFKDCTFEDFCDQAGGQVSDKGKTSIQILNDKGINPRCKKTEIQYGIEIIEKRLSKLIDGLPAMMISSKDELMKDMFAGGYCYMKSPSGSAFKEVPYKDGFYEHIADGLRYIMHFFYDVDRRMPYKLKIDEPSFITNDNIYRGNPDDLVRTYQ